MLELQNNHLIFSFPEVHEGAKFSLEFQRTLRIPDDDKEYPLPPGLGAFPIRHVDDFKDRVPAKWAERGGVMLPMFQSEAMWIAFHPQYVRCHGTYPVAIKIATGKVSAVTGERWSVGLKEGDYLVAPPQPWLDGYVVEKGLIRQFVAAPLGWGFSAEEQITGKAEHGGIQIEVIPMKADVFERRFPKQDSILRSMDYSCDSISFCDSDERGIAVAAAAAADMSLAPGGKMKQQVHEDPYDISDWDVANRSRVFVHLANSLVWKAITEHDPPHPPPTAKSYASSGLPWFEHYRDDLKSLAGTEALKGLKSVLKMGFQKGIGILPENESAAIKSDQVHQLRSRSKNEVREGRW